MKEIKWLISHLIIAAYTSSWWAYVAYGKIVNEFPLVLIPFLSTIGLVIFFICYLTEHWNEK